VDAASALADLTELSTDVRAAVVLDATGAVAASAGHPEPERLAAAGAELWQSAGAVQGERAVAQLEVALPDASVFVVRSGAHRIVATTGPKPSSALVLHDLRACLGSLDQPKPKRRRKKAAAGA
jgi:predicted regulator of Ras-like GTPase activity (Roadblock/LC7/MglB family)